ncbi:ZIP family zinc transporter [Caldicoprobacter guelmensis]|nr:ZIP family metal transporter [Caldicoprobacter guelmensis]MBM7582427.1 ZIP family zinc transporter [Caldicoprobacter guelmensis]
MDKLPFSCIMGTAAGIVGTGLGGLMGFVLNNPSRRFLSTLLNFSAGLMMAVVCFDLLPEAFEIGGFGISIIGVCLGVIMIVTCDEAITSWKSYFKRNRNSAFLRQYIKTGVLLGIGIALHNFPEGLAIGSGFTAMESYGLGLSLVIAFHDVPEGIAMAAPMRIGGMGKWKVFLSAVMAGVPTGIGALVGYLLGEISPYFISLCLGFAGGAMLYITCLELIPRSRDLYRGRVPGLGLIVGVIAGIVVSSLL